MQEGNRRARSCSRGHAKLSSPNSGNSDVITEARKFINLRGRDRLMGHAAGGSRRPPSSSCPCSPWRRCMGQQSRGTKRHTTNPQWRRCTGQQSRTGRAQGRDAGGIRHKPFTPPFARSRSGKPRSRSGGDARGSRLTRTNSVNVTIAHYVLTEDCTIKDLVWLLGNTPANIVVINFDRWLETSERREKLREALVESVWLQVMLVCVAVLGTKTRVGGLRLLLTTNGGRHRFMFVACSIIPSRLSEAGSVVRVVFACQNSSHTPSMTRHGHYRWPPQ